MKTAPTRRVILGGLLASFGSAGFARAPETSPRPLPRGGGPVPAAPKELLSRSEELVRNANLGGEVGFAVVDMRTGELLESRLGSTYLPPASTLKTVTALYALDRLGAEFRFPTTVVATGPVKSGRVEGDLVLVGGGDPTLDTDRMADLAIMLREGGIREVTGKFLVYAGALPRSDRIDADQPEHVSYNPAFGGLNLNFNRVHFEWKRSQDNYEITMQARALRFRPSTSVASMSVVDRQSPVFDHWTNGSRDNWTVARRALGRDGARWLPVRFPALYAGDVFRTLARSNGILLKPAELIDKPATGTELARIESEALRPILQEMLKYSTNLTAEVSGLTATTSNGAVGSLEESARQMANYARSNGSGFVLFQDHSGLNYGSSITPRGMASVLAANPELAPLLKRVDLSLDKDRPAPAGIEVLAKTGTLNFVSSLAGFIYGGERPMAFAFFSADTERRDAIPPAERERPPGAKGWSRRSRQLQKELIRDWTRRYA